MFLLLIEEIVVLAKNQSLLNYSKYITYRSVTDNCIANRLSVYCNILLRKLASELNCILHFMGKVLH